METIPEEDILDLSNAEVDFDDLECIKVTHKPTGYDVLVKKEFKGGQIVDDNGKPIGE